MAKILSELFHLVTVTVVYPGMQCMCSMGSCEWNKLIWGLSDKVSSWEGEREGRDEEQLGMQIKVGRQDNGLLW